MSSKVTCTCGHSWSKASSSKKDMNVCHICGKDNTMKDGGWLNRYNDGGPMQENYNDASATEGPNYVGAGYDIIGRNYSPAWGGQFEKGGNIVSYEDAKAGNKKAASMNSRDNPNARMNTFSKNRKQVDLFDELISAPQKSAVYLTGQGYRKPSEALGIKNPYGALATDMILDPTNLLFFLKQGKIAKAVEEASKPKMMGPFNMTHPRDAARIQNVGNKYKIAAGASDAANYYNEFEHGGTLPGSVGFSYARTKGIPSNGPYAKKTLASAQNGKEMQFYQNGLDWKPKSISKNGAWLDKFQEGGEKTYGPYNLPEVTVTAPGMTEEELYRDRVQKSMDDLDYLNIKSRLTPTQTKNYLSLQDKGKIVNFCAAGSTCALKNAGEQFEQPGNVNGIYFGNYTFKDNAEKEGYIKQSNANAMKKGDIMQFVDYENEPHHMALYHSTIPTHRGEKTIRTFQNNGDGNMNYKDYVPESQLHEMYWNDKPKIYSNGNIYNLYNPLDDYGKNRIGGYSSEEILYLINNKVSNEETEGLNVYTKDFKNKKKDGGIIEDDRGQWDHPGEVTKINSNEITMQGVPYPVLGVSDTGDTQMMQPGEDYTYDGKSVTEYPMMKDGGWLSKYDVPKAQAGLNFKELMNPGIKQDATKVVRQEVMSEAEAKKLKARKDAEELARRKQAIATSAAAKKKPFSTKQLAEETGAIADKLRLFPNDPNSFIDDYINPGVMVGNMASGLGRVPLDVQEGNYGQAALSVLTPLATGALAGIGAKSTGQFANNLFNPLAGLENIPKDITQKIIPATNSIKERLGLIDDSKAIDDHIAGISLGFSKKDKRPFFEKFPITNAQKSKVYAMQDQALKEGKDFIKDWFYGDQLHNSGSKIHPDIVKKMQEIDPSFILPTSKDIADPFEEISDVLVGSRRNDVLNDTNISDYAKEYLIKNRGRIGGVNIGGDNLSITLRNQGLYHYDPSYVKDIVMHEAGHTAQTLGKLPTYDANTGRLNDWNVPFDNINTLDTNFTEYYHANPNTEEGRLFKEAMIEPKPGGSTWTAAPIELHSELLPARSHLIDSYVKKGYDRKEMMDALRSGASDEQVDWMIQDKKLNRFFKPSTSQETKRQLIKMLPAAVPVAIGAKALSEQKNGGWLNKYN